MTSQCQGHAAESARAENPEALRLADLLDFNASSGHFTTSDQEEEAATELRRLHALCEEMGEALNLLLDEVFASGNGDASDYGWPKALNSSKAALAKWKESK